MTGWLAWRHRIESCIHRNAGVGSAGDCDLFSLAWEPWRGKVVLASHLSHMSPRPARGYACSHARRGPP
jgi:hypothetical protein